MRVLLITGASRGIGAAIARSAVRNGWDVGVGFSSDRTAAEAVAEDVRRHGRQAVPIQGDVSDPASVEEMFDHTGRAIGSVSGLVNSAGIATGVGAIEDLCVAATHRMLEVNVFGLYLCCRAAVRRMAKRHGGQGGVIVNISSAAARSTAPGRFVDYAAGKAAVDTLTIGLAKGQAPQGIRVYGIRPGVIHTEMAEQLAEKDPGWLERIKAAIPNGRIGEVGDVASAAIWLLSDEAGHATGSIVDVSGGKSTQ